MKILNIIIEAITAPFNLLFRANAAPNQNKVVKPIIVLAISVVILVGLIFAYYYGVMFKW